MKRSKYLNKTIVKMKANERCSHAAFLRNCTANDSSDGGECIGTCTVIERRRQLCITYCG